MFESHAFIIRTKKWARKAPVFVAERFLGRLTFEKIFGIMDVQGTFILKGWQFYEKQAFDWVSFLRVFLPFGFLC
jgi:hypothetical protein